MALPGHVKAAFEHLRGAARKATHEMIRQHRGPHLEAGSQVTDPGEVAKAEGDSCPECESGVCEEHDTGMEDLQAMHDERHEGHQENHLGGHHDQADEEEAEHGFNDEDQAAEHEGEGGHNPDEPHGHRIGGLMLGGHGKKSKFKKHGF